MIDRILAWIWSFWLHIWASLSLSITWSRQVWSCFFRGGAVFLVVTAFLLIPVVLYQIQVEPTITSSLEKPPQDWDSQEKKRVFRYSVVVFCLQILLNSLLGGLLVFDVERGLAGYRTSFHGFLGRDFGSFLGMLSTAVLVTSAVLLGLFPFVVPGFFFLSMCFVAVPAMVKEKGGGFQCLGRSYSLTQGHWIAILGLLFLLQFPVMLGFIILGQWLSGGEGQFWLRFLLSVVSVSLHGTASAVVYIQLRMRKEGFSPEANSDGG